HGKRRDSRGSAPSISTGGARGGSWKALVAVVALAGSVRHTGAGKCRRPGVDESVDHRPRRSGSAPLLIERDATRDLNLAPSTSERRGRGVRVLPELGDIPLSPPVIVPETWRIEFRNGIRRQLVSAEGQSFVVSDLLRNR